MSPTAWTRRNSSIRPSSPCEEPAFWGVATQGGTLELWQRFFEGFPWECDSMIHQDVQTVESWHGNLAKNVPHPGSLQYIYVYFYFCDLMFPLYFHTSGKKPINNTLLLKAHILQRSQDGCVCHLRCRR